MQTVTKPPLSANSLPSPAIADHRHHLLLPISICPTTIHQFKQLHAQVLRSGHDNSFSFLLSKLLSFPFSSPPSLDYILTVFLHSPHLDTRICHRALRTFSRAPDGPRRALIAYACIRRSEVEVDRFMFPTLLSAAAKFNGGDGVAARREAHGLVLKLGFLSDPFIQTSLAGAYAAGGMVEDARKVFDRMLYKDVVAWNVMLDCYYQAGQYDDTLMLFEAMRNSGFVPDNVVLSTIITACGRTGNLSFGKKVHSFMTESKIKIDDHIQSALITMYCNCNSMSTAQNLYDQMSHKNLVASTAMIFGYSKLGKIEIARSIFDRMHEKDLICWSAMISGYVESEQPVEALKLFNGMSASGMNPDNITILSVISACSHLGAIDLARWIHIYANKNGFDGIVSVNNALIDMYAKCGSLEMAQTIFEKLPQRNVITWTTMITGLAMHGEGRSALELFNEMKAMGFEPNGVTFVGLLYACSHSGMVEEGRCMFKMMIHEHGIEPKHEHYGCLVDLLGRAKLLQEAHELIESMPFQPNVVEWGSLLWACQIHGNIVLGKLAAKKLLELDPGHDGAYVLLSNIYAKANRWEKVEEVRRLMKDRAVPKEKGYSWIEMDGEVHEFLAGDDSHSRSAEIYDKLDEVVKALEVAGYFPDIGSVLLNLEEDEKRAAILLHSEKLALSFGLIGLNPGSCIRIAKNLRVCRDCHSFMKLASIVYKREIILRDRTRFHHFMDGNCSCREFW
ncbi:pentatricopeptide repeat-containing protein At4g14820 [Phalaenopsis equestris]|uniref:pentatricopeptide repeat-containing protein At4g14820 n=1 Tax=Phalaenopsis equestris TaxID=78828 RepID=UPI0009E21861|nr:pentatricopeptide repeat-containing protein At4g14820 [Phalaenopsis equestris]